MPCKMFTTDDMNVMQLLRAPSPAPDPQPGRSSLPRACAERGQPLPDAPLQKAGIVEQF